MLVSSEQARAISKHQPAFAAAKTISKAVMHGPTLEHSIPDLELQLPRRTAGSAACCMDEPAWHIQYEDEYHPCYQCRPALLVELPRPCEQESQETMLLAQIRHHNLPRLKLPSAQSVCTKHKKYDSMCTRAGFQLFSQLFGALHNSNMPLSSGLYLYGSVLVCQNWNRCSAG